MGWAACPSWLALITAIGCGFHAGAATVDAPDNPVETTDAVRDSATCVPQLGSACGGKLWATDFQSDPTKLDINCDGVPDWALRNGSSFPTTQLGSEGWQAPAPSEPLDTEPRQPFTTRVVIDAAMQSTQMPALGGYGAVFWINVDYNAAGAFAVVFADLELQADATQTLYLYSKDTTGSAYEITNVGQLPAAFVPIHLDIDPTTLHVQYALDGGTTSETTIQQIGSASTDQWATLVAYSAAASFQSIRVEVCPQ